MEQLHRYCRLLIAGLLLVTLANANSSDKSEEFYIANDNYGVQTGASLLSSDGSRHRLSLHRKSRQRHLLIESLRSGNLEDVMTEEEEDVDNGDADGDSTARLLQKKKKKNGGNTNKKKRIDNRKPRNNNNKERKRKVDDKDGNNKKNSNNKKNKKDDDKRKDRKDAYYKQSPEWCLCEDLYGPGYWKEYTWDSPYDDWSPRWNEDDDYDDDYSYDDDDDFYKDSATSKRKQYKKNARNKKKNGRLLEEGEQEYQSIDSRDDENTEYDLESEEVDDEEDNLSDEEENDTTTSLAEMFAAAVGGESGGVMNMLRFQKNKRQNRQNNNNKKRNKQRNGGRRSNNNGKQGSWGRGNNSRGNWNDFDNSGKGRKDRRNVNPGNNEIWSDDDWSDDEWGGDEWMEKDKWCPCPLVPTKMPTYTPTVVTEPPTLSPSYSPTDEPTMYPTIEPTRSPSMEPTRHPTPRPSKPPTPQPSVRPGTPPPTAAPTKSPTQAPLTPTQDPSESPSAEPTGKGSPVFSAVGYNWGAKAGVGGPLEQTQPTPERFIYGFPISNITAGPGYTIYLDTDSNAFASGYVESLSAYKGQFGVGDDFVQGSNINRPVKFVIRNGEQREAPRFERVYAGGDHSAFIDKAGRVYTTGSNSRGKLCLGDNGGDMKKVPHFVTLPSKSTVVSVALGLDFTLILLDNGQVYGCGSNDLGQIGLGDTIASVNTPTRTGNSLGPVKAISAGADFSMYLTDSRQAYSSGSNLYKQQCRDTGGKPALTPTEISTQGFSVVDIEAGRASSYLLLSDGKSLPGIASCGRNNEGQLCGNVTNAKAQVKLPSVNATSIWSGPTAQTVFFYGVDTTAGYDVLYGCGQNVLDQVGVGSNQQSQISTPKRLNFSGSRSFSIEISASSSHTVAIGSFSLSEAPTENPSFPPTTSNQPSAVPTNAPTHAPTQKPTNAPTEPTATAPSTASPTAKPTNSPTDNPGSTKSPTHAPTSAPTPVPTNAPTPAPTNAPTTSPTASPTSVDAKIKRTDNLTPGSSSSDFVFGWSVAISDTISGTSTLTSALIGAPLADDEGLPLGAAYLFDDVTRNTPVKLESKISTPSPTPIDLSFECGYSVALSQTLAVFGCPGYRELTNEYGAVAIYIREKLTAGAKPIYIEEYNGQNLGLRFGSSLSINSNGFLAVGSISNEVYVYLVKPGVPPNDHLYKLSPSGLNPTQNNFGWSVALNDDTDPMLAVGAIRQNGVGSVYLYKNLNTEPEEIRAPSAATEDCDECRFGYSVAFYQNTLVVGSPGTHEGAGRVFVYNDVTLEDFQDDVRILPVTPPAGSLFGRSVTITNGAIVVGSPNYKDSNGNEVGAAHFFNKDANGGWYLPTFEEDYPNPITGGGNLFGSATAISESAFVVGAPFDQGGKATIYSYESASPPSTFVAPTDTTDSTSTLDDFTEVEVSNDCKLAYKVMTWDALAISMELTCEGVEEWVGIGFSSDGLMQNSEAVLGVPGNATPLRYALNGKSTDAVVPMPVEQQTLINATFELENDGKTVMKFTKILEMEAGEDIHVLFARGMSPTLGYHAERSSVKITV